MAAALSHDKTRDSNKGAQKPSRIRPLTHVLVDELFDVALDSSANVAVNEERQRGLPLQDPFVS